MTELKTLDDKIKFMIEMGDNIGATALAMLGIYRELRTLNARAMAKEIWELDAEAEADYAQTIHDARPGG